LAAPLHTRLIPALSGVVLGSAVLVQGLLQTATRESDGDRMERTPLNLYRTPASPAMLPRQVRRVP